MVYPRALEGNLISCQLLTKFILGKFQLTIKSTILDPAKVETVIIKHFKF